MTIEDIGYAVIRIEGKLDVMSSGQAAQQASIVDHEGRIRVLEQKPVVTTRMFWSAVVGTATAVGAITQFITLATRK